MEFPSKGTILAPAGLHLPLYHALYKAHGDTAGLQVLGLEAWAGQEAAKEPAGLVFQAADRLKTLPETNTFSGSFQDADFINSCLDFLRRAKLAGIDQFPADTKKEQDLKEILEALLDLDLVQAGQRDFLQDRTFEDVWMLDTKVDSSKLALVDLAKQAGARPLETGKAQVKTFHSAANIRKCLEAVAKDIVESGIPAESCLIALADPSWLYVLEQVFSAWGIPYTNLHPKSGTVVQKQFGAILRYIRNKSRETWLHLVQTLYPSSSRDVVEYDSLFGVGRDLSSMPYEDNPLVSQKQFAKWQLLEASAKEWMLAHDFIPGWTLDSLESFGQAIQNVNPDPTEEDRAVLDKAVELFGLAKEDQLDLLVQLVEGLQAPVRPDAIAGAAIGGVNDISALHEQVYFVGPHAGLFPGLKTWNGLFDEAYARKAGFPPLKDRLERQRENLFGALSQPANLHVYVPQSDYTGKSLESSFELEQFMGEKPEFVPVPDRSVWRMPDFSMKIETATDISARSLQVFAQCPLRHHLRYGLQLKPAYAPSLKADRQLMETVLEKARSTAHPDLEALVLEQYRFVMKLFPDRAAVFKAQALQEAALLKPVLEKLNVFETKLHLELLNKEVQVSTDQWQGNLQAWQNGKLSLAVVENGQDAGIVEIPLHEKAGSYPAMTASYRSKLPQLKDVGLAEAAGDTLWQGVQDSLVLQDLSDAAPQDLKKKPTFAQRMEQLDQQRKAYLEKQGVLEPVHADGACKYCAYSRICRNASRTKEEGQ